MVLSTILKRTDLTQITYPVCDYYSPHRTPDNKGSMDEILQSGKKLRPKNIYLNFLNHKSLLKMLMILFLMLKMNTDSVFLITGALFSMPF